MDMPSLKKKMNIGCQIFAFIWLSKNTSIIMYGTVGIKMLPIERNR
jgi:hypothetical protein